MAVVSLIVHVVTRSTLLCTRLIYVLPLAYARKRAAQRYFVSELRALGVPDDAIEAMTASYRDMLHLNPLAYRDLWHVAR